jgi:hypothetical protein
MPPARVAALLAGSEAGIAALRAASTRAAPDPAASTRAAPDPAASTRAVLAAGAESGQQIALRAAAAVAERIGATPVTFPGGRAGFLGGEYGQTGEPAAFAETLHKVLAG